MKTNKYQSRFYRGWVDPLGLSRIKIIVKETDLDILSDKPIDKDIVKQRVSVYRRQIETYIARDERFLTSLKPIAVDLSAPLIIKEMARCAKKANVGPMAAIAGAIAQFIGQGLLKEDFKEVIIENGGDIFIKITKPRKVGVYAGHSKLSGRIFFKINPEDTPLGLCTSSGTVGHSLSFGSAEAVVILAKNAILADATATATANLVNSKNDLPRAVKFARSIRGITGIAIIFKNNLATWGAIELVGPD